MPRDRVPPPPLRTHPDPDHADNWRPNGSQTPQAWLIDALLREDEEERYRLVRIYGTAFEPRDLPLEYELAPEGCCFANAFQLASEHPDLRYVEGYCTLWGSDTWIHRHGWCIDGSDRVVDPTWGTGQLPLAYRGVLVPLNIAERYAKPFSTAPSTAWRATFRSLRTRSASNGLAKAENRLMLQVDRLAPARGRLNPVHVGATANRQRRRRHRAAAR